MLPVLDNLHCGGRRVALRLFPGTGDDAPLQVLFIHGWGGAQDANDVRLARELAREGFRCLTFDLGGHGHSEGRAEDFTLEDYLAQAVAAYDRLATSPVPVVVSGSSLGAYLAARLSAERPVAALSLRVPANYPDEVFATQPVAHYIAGDAPRAWRSRPCFPSENRALAALRGFRGPVQLIAAGQDETIPCQTTKNFMNALERAALQYHLLADATHTLYSVPAMRRESFRLVRGWLLSMVTGENRMSTQSTAPGATLPLVHHYIHGQVVTTAPARTVPVFNPALGRPVRQVAMATVEELDAAVQSARAAQPAWGRTSALQRSRVLFRFKELLVQHSRQLAEIISAEHGKTVADAEGEVTRGMEVVEFACGAPQLLKGEFSESVGTGVDSYGIRQPLGIVAGITPFNFPAMVPMWMFPVALACGNAFILKPSERDPSAALYMADLLTQAGLPAGIFNVVQGDKVAVDAILEHPHIAAVSFVGSTPIARYIQQQGVAHGKRVQALGGAKNHAVIMPDADLDAACEAVVGAAYGSAGERCMAISVVVAVGEATADGLITRFEKRIAQLKVGAPDAPGMDMGPLVTDAARERVMGYIHAGEKAGAKLCMDGRGVKVADRPDGYYVGPTLFDHVTPEMSVYRDEIFGPVLSVVRVPDYAAALALVNSHEYANGTVIFTQSGAIARAFVREVEVGMVGINVPVPVPMAFHSFGGWRSSLFGDHHMHGPEGVRFYTRLKTVTERWPEPKSVSADFVMPTMK